MIKHRYNWQLNKAKDNILNFRVSWNNNSCVCKFSSGYRVEISKWSQEAHRCKPNSMHPNDIPASVINRRIDEYESVADKLLVDFYNNDHIPTTEEFRTAFNKAIGKEKSNEQQQQTIRVIEALYQFQSIVGQQNNWSDATRKNFHTLANHFAAFNSNLTTDELDKEQMRMFHQYLIKNGFNNNTIRKMFKSVRQFIRWIRENNMYTGDADNYTMRLKGVTDNIVIYLTWNELISIYNMSIDEQYLQRVRDVFCFCCFTSLRYSDVSKLHKSDIKENHIEIITQKTSEPLIIELNDYSRELLKKYENTSFEHDLALPVMTNQKMNNYLKELAQRAGLDTPIRKVHYVGSERKEKVYRKWELITTHCGRRTFIVNALYLGIPAEVVMKWTGHADYNAMKPYIAIVDELKSREMQKFNRH
ncbi:MAG: site-specific integrase [Bacteroides sp.]|nr:site-specific integrase [Bacteroides sp.]MCM1403800.1 site-specific integrase [Bacteroides sp.]MCM1443548.1 site-specific integrase [Muribaculum sp.]MCM1577117.1 site-specific integrase [Bacteroides sp.]